MAATSAIPGYPFAELVPTSVSKTASDNALQFTLKPKRHPTTARLNRGVKAQLCGGRQEPQGKGDLGKRFTARDCQPPVKRAKRGSNLASAPRREEPYDLR